MIDGHEVVTLPPKRKPDIPVYWAPKAPSKAVLQKDDIVPSAYYLVAVGEVKGRTSRPTGFSAEELGLLEAFLRDLLISQSYRKIALGFLTDGNIIQFLWLRVAPDRTFSANLSAPYDLRQNDTAGPGARLLHGLLQAEPEQLGAKMHTVMLENLEVNIGLHLGRGSTSTVWRGMHKGKDVVVKISHAELGGVTRSHEQKALETLARSLPHAFRNSVPRLCGVDARANALVMVPCGKFFALSTSQLGRGLLPHPQPEHFCALVDILQQVHQCARLVHRDLAPRNFYMDPTDEHVRSPPSQSYCLTLFAADSQRLGQCCSCWQQDCLSGCSRVCRQQRAATVAKPRANHQCTNP